MSQVLAQALDAELAMVQDLISICREEQQALCRDDLNRLAAAVEVKKELAAALAEVERRRVEAQVALWPEAQVNLPDEAGCELGDAGAGLAEKTTNLVKALGELKEINNTNDLLIRQSLAYARRMLALLLPGGGQGGGKALFNRTV